MLEIHKIVFLHQQGDLKATTGLNSDISQHDQHHPKHTANAVKPQIEKHSIKMIVGHLTVARDRQQSPGNVGHGGLSWLRLEDAHRCVCTD